MTANTNPTDLIKNWTPDRLPDLSGKRYLITGGNSGIGLDAAKILASQGADIIIACRNVQKANVAAAEIDATGATKVDIVELDLSSMQSVREAADTCHNRYSQLDGLINNAGIMQTPETRTEDGFELQFGTNHLGHFLFAGLLYELIKKAAGRIVTVSSIIHKVGHINFDDLMLTRSYSPTKAYSQSKLANLLFALELDRRLKAANSPVSSIACHPGYSNTSLQSTGPKGLLSYIYKLSNKLAQSSYQGAIPTVLAAAASEAVAGHYYGPCSLGDSMGPVGDTTIAPRARDEDVADKLWKESERLVDFTWSL